MYACICVHLSMHVYMYVGVYMCTYAGFVLCCMHVTYIYTHHVYKYVCMYVSQCVCMAHEPIPAFCFPNVAGFMTIQSEAVSIHHAMTYLDLLYI